MAQTYAQLQDQIAKLQAEAESIRHAELAAVIAKLRSEIASHGITPQDLFGKDLGKLRKRSSKSTAQAKYADGAGNFWVGRGPRPKWLRDALAAGKRLEEFVFGGHTAKSASSSSAPARKSAVRKVSAKKAAAKTAAKKKASSTK